MEGGNIIVKLSSDDAPRGLSGPAAARVFVVLFVCGARDFDLTGLTRGLFVLELRPEPLPRIDAAESGRA